MSDPLVHYHLVRFCGLTRLGYMCRTLFPSMLLSPNVDLEDFDLAVSAEIFTNGVGEQWRDWSDTTLATLLLATQEKLETLLLVSEMPVSIPRIRTVGTNQDGARGRLSKTNTNDRTAEPPDKHLISL